MTDATARRGGVMLLRLLAFRLWSFSHSWQSPRCTGWIRLGANGPGIRWTMDAPYFSERYGYDKPFARVGSLRWFWLRR